jgi:hypothetical protein
VTEFFSLPGEHIAENGLLTEPIQAVPPKVESRKKKTRTGRLSGAVVSGTDATPPLAKAPNQHRYEPILW